MIHLRVWGTLPRLSASLQCLATGQARTLTHKNNPVPQTLGRGPWRCTSHLCLPQSLQVPSVRLSGSSHLCLPQSLQVPSVRLSGSSCLCLPPPLRVPSVRESVCRSGTRVGGLRPLSTRSGLAVRVAEDSVHLTLAGREVGVPLVWLRDHCRCEICYNSTTWQKNVDNYSLQGLSVLHIEIKEDSLLVTCEWCECVCVCVCVCVWEREREREREGCVCVRERERCVLCMCVCVCVWMLAHWHDEDYWMIFSLMKCKSIISMHKTNSVMYVCVCVCVFVWMCKSENVCEQIDMMWTTE